VGARAVEGERAGLASPLENLVAAGVEHVPPLAVV
jgi:hypothetical protein